MGKNHFSKKHVAFLNALCHADSSQRKTLLRTADRALVRCICECALNVLHGVVQLKESEKARLKKHKSVLRKLVQTNGKNGTSWQSKKRTIIQSGGGFLPLLLAPLISTIFSKIIG